MKNKILRLISSVLILLLLCITTTGATYTEADDDKSWHVTEKVYFGDNYTGFKYQVIPGTDNWPYGDHWKMVEMCQIPIEECKSMSTNQLLDTVVAYPLMGDIMAYDDWKTGFEVIKSSFNGLSELLTREDLDSALKDKEKSIRDSRDEFNKENPVSVTKKETFIPANNDVDYRRMRYTQESSALMYISLYTDNSFATEEVQSRSYPEYFITHREKGVDEKPRTWA